MDFIDVEIRLNMLLKKKNDLLTMCLSIKKNCHASLMPANEL